MENIYNVMYDGGIKILPINVNNVSRKPDILGVYPDFCKISQKGWSKL
jgi:hypothetical protein